jgi:hypothetical protein
MRACSVVSLELWHADSIQRAHETSPFARDVVIKLRPENDVTQKRRAGLEAEVRKLEDEQERFVAAIAIAGNVQALARALHEREQRRSQIRSELALLDRAEELGSFDVRHIERELRARLADWRELLHRQVPIARQVVTQLLDGRIVCTPHRDERLYEFAGRVKFDQLLSGIVFTQGVVPVRRFEPRSRR